MSSEAIDREEAIGQFCGVTGADEERAKGLLEACDWNLELAINMHVDTDDGRANRPSTSRNSIAGASTSNSAPLVTINDSIDDDKDEDDVNISIDRPTILSDGTSIPFPSRDGTLVSDLRGASSSATTSSSSSAAARARSSQPAASSAYCDPDNVRPPIPPVRQVLVQHPGGYPPDLPQRRYNTRTGAVSDVYDAFRDFQAEAQWQEMAQESEAAASASADPSSAAALAASNANKRRTLQELFRPPLDVMFRGSLSSAREVGSLQNKWLLANIQNSREFACQILNRDVWSNQTVKDILKEHFIFWQVCHDSFEGARYMQFYNVSSFPHVSIIDPRTGEQMKSWRSSIDHNSFCDSVIEFLTEHPSPDGSSDANSMKKLCVKEDSGSTSKTTLYDQSEEAQLEAAIKASLQEADGSSHHGVVDVKAESSGADNQEDEEVEEDDYDDDDDELAEVEDIIKPRATKQLNTNNVAMDEKEITAKEEEVEDYQKYLGSDTEKFSDLNIRFPDGTRDTFKFPSDSLMKALFLLLTSRGYGMNHYNYVTNFPRRLLHQLPGTDTLHDAKLIRETIFVERKVSDDH